LPADWISVKRVHYLEVMDQLSGEALTPAATVRFMEQVTRET